MVLPSPCPCPLCRRGSLTSMVMMETLNCDFCGHLFGLEGLGVTSRDQLQVLDLAIPYTWSWQGDRWQSQEGQSAAATPWIWFLAGVLFLFPPALVVLGTYCFPPLDPAPGLTFGQGWAIATALVHGGLGLWVLGSYYQLTLFLAAQGRGWWQWCRRRGLLGFLAS